MNCWVGTLCLMLDTYPNMACSGRKGILNIAFGSSWAASLPISQNELRNVLYDSSLLADCNFRESTLRKRSALRGRGSDPSIVRVDLDPQISYHPH